MINQILRHQPYEAATFECQLCEHSFQLDFTTIRALLNPFHHINCPHCQHDLSLQLDSKRLLVKRLNSMVGLTKLLLFLVIPYFLVSAFVIYNYRGVIATVCLVIGFVLIMLLRFKLRQPVNSLYYLEEAKQQPLTE